jgi:hypothetical protein
MLLINSKFTGPYRVQLTGFIDKKILPGTHPLITSSSHFTKNIVPFSPRPGATAKIYRLTHRISIEEHPIPALHTSRRF